jgi:radical SAM superfamily enzyme YgiQ (UPF0313 family)
LKITFLTPPVLDGTADAERVFGCTYGLYPIPNIFALTAAAVLEKTSHRVRFLDASIAGMQPRDFEEYLKQDDSELYCFYSVNLSRTTDLLAHSRIREIRKDLPVAFLGPAPSYNPAAFLFDSSTYVVRGEPEHTLRDLAEALARKGSDLDRVNGLSFRKNGTLLENPPREIERDLDVFPFPARHLIDREKYFNPKLGIRPFTAVLTSRGCAFRCRYCVPCSLSFARELEFGRFNGKKPPVAFRSAENVLAELDELKREGFRAVSIIDDQFVWEKKRALAIIEGIGSRGFRWGCLARADALDDEVMRAMKEARCGYLDLGVESFHQPILDDIRKSATVEETLEKLRKLKEFGIPLKLNVLIGSSPLETRETIRTNIEILRKLKPDQVMFSICNPFPGTEFWDVARKEKWLTVDEYRPVDVQKQSLISYPHLPASEMEKAIRQANLRFFLSPRFVLKSIIKFRSPSVFLAAVRSLWKKLF